MGLLNFLPKLLGLNIELLDDKAQRIAAERIGLACLIVAGAIAFLLVCGGIALLY